MDNRQVFPVLYNLHHATFREDLPFWLELISFFGGPVLELGCGTGRVTFPLAQTGKSIFALDFDSAMLEFLQAVLREQPTWNIYPFLADMAAFHLRLKFGCILLPCNTLSTLSPLQRQQTFQCVKRHLAKNGGFIASLPNPELLRKLPASSPAEIEEILEHPKDHNPVQISSEWRRRKNQFHLTWHYDHLKQNGQVERFDIHITHSLDSLECYQEHLAANGLKLLQIFGDFDRSTYQPDSPNLILIAVLG